jgi:hypothetical protein
MTEEQQFFIAVLKLMPDNSIVYMQAWSIKSTIISELLVQSEDPALQRMQLNSESRAKLIAETINDRLPQYVSYIEIRKDGMILFKAYDGVEIGDISQEIPVTEEFIKNFVTTKMCAVVSEVSSY